MYYYGTLSEHVETIKENGIKPSTEVFTTIESCLHYLEVDLDLYGEEYAVIPLDLAPDEVTAAKDDRATLLKPITRPFNYYVIYSA